MPFLISDSPTPLLMETVPVLKTTYFQGQPQRDCVYAYVRMYVCQGALQVSMTVFDATPPETSRFGLAMQSADCLDKFLLLCAGPVQGSCALTVQNSATGALLQALEAPFATWLRGADEQGWYWSAQATVPAAVFIALFGTAPKAGIVYAGNAFLYDLCQPAFGAAFPVPLGNTAPCAAGFEPFTIVPY